MKHFKTFESFKRGVNGVGSLKNTLAVLKKENILRYPSPEDLAMAIHKNYEAITGEKYEDATQMSMDDVIADTVAHFKMDGPDFMAAWDKVIKESYDGNLSDFKYDFELALDNLGINSKAIKAIKKVGKGFEVRMSSYMSDKNTWDRLGTDIGANLVDFKKGSINVGIYERANLNEGATANNDLGALFLKFLWVRDQAHIFHWQTKSNSQHVTLGDFYEDYLDELDELAESIFGRTGQTFSIGNGTIELVDYSPENLMTFCNESYDLFNVEFKRFFPNSDDNLGLYHILGDILELINKAKYLLSQQ